MEQLKHSLKQAYDHISRLQVSGDAVDLTAMARAQLRSAWAAAERLEQEAEHAAENS